MSETFHIRNLSFCYRSYPGLESKPLFSNLSFEIPKGKISFFLALPGSGKTTLAGIISDLIPAYTGGELSGNPDPGADTGIVFQNPDDQIFCDTAEKELAFPLECRGTDPAEIERKITEALEITGISHLRYKNPAGFSGGEKRRLMLAALCCTEPELWLLDETLEEIDVFGKRELLDFLSRQKRTVLIFTSKLPDVYREYGSCFMLWHEGSLTSYGRTGFTELTESLRQKGFLPDTGIHAEKKHRDTAGSEAPVLEMRNIKFSYPDSGFNLDIEHLELRRGKITALLGTNGCGKSTLSRLAAGLLVPDSGRIILEGKDADPKQLNRCTSYLFQNPDCQFFLPTVKEELEYGLKLRKLPEEEIRNKCTEAADLFGLQHPDAPPSLLSYGERKKLQAAIYWLLGKETVIIDEADSGISFREFRTMLEAIGSTSPAPAILIITHDLRLAEIFSDTVHYMKNGRFAEIPPELGL